MRRDLALFAVLAALAFGRPLVAPRPAPSLVPADPGAPAPAEPACRSTLLPESAPSVHAATAVATAEGGLLAMWFGGSAEGARDVAIFLSELPSGASDWTEPRAVLTRARAASDLGMPVRRLGNPVLVREDDGALRLFVVVTSLGGWSTSYVATMTSGDRGGSWSRARRLVASPFFNLGVLVRNAPLRYGDGALGLPVSHELWSPYGEILRVEKGAVTGVARLTAGRGGFQPAPVALSATRAVALLRRRGGTKRLLRSESGDGGLAWAPAEPLALPNDDSAVAVLALGGDELLLAFNDGASRRNLSLARSGDGGLTWRRVHVVEEREEGEFSYPWWVVAPDGTFHLLYTWNRTRIGHLAFNRSWLDGRG